MILVAATTVAIVETASVVEPTIIVAPATIAIVEPAIVVESTIIVAAAAAAAATVALLVDVISRRERRRRELELSRKEFDLLAELVRHAGRVVTREDLMSRVWDENWFGSTKTLDVHMGGLRRRLDDEAARRAASTPCGVAFPVQPGGRSGPVGLRARLLLALAYVLVLVVVALEAPLASSVADRDELLQLSPRGRAHDRGRAARPGGARHARRRTLGRDRGRRGQTLTASADGAGAAWLSREDADRILDALVENARGYSPAGSAVEVAASAARLEVRDRGPGLAAGEEEHVFERFHRGGAARGGDPERGRPADRARARAAMGRRGHAAQARPRRHDRRGPAAPGMSLCLPFTRRLRR
ncbi:MAG TPA: winged helix-turn-helix domain-containing protein [Solirubrobacteraceae bacterium]|nr:winged helix-turn-helix domain-containing protein [Solirubrobacteraceae bacterium]